MVISGPVPSFFIPGVSLTQEAAFSLSEFRGRYLVLVFYSGDWELAARDILLSFSGLRDKFSAAQCELAACSTDSPRVHKSWIKTESEDGGFSGELSLPLWSDPSGHLASQFDLFDPEECRCLDGVVVIDDEGVVRHTMTTSLETEDTATSTLELVKLLKVYKEDSAESKKQPAANRSLISSSMEKDWDVSRDPEVLKALDAAKRLGRRQPVHMVYRPRNPTFDLAPARIRRLVNPRASTTSCSASVYRNLAGFGSGTDISTNQKLQIENIMSKVLGVAFMPEELSGEYKSLSGLNARQLGDCFNNEIFSVSGDSWAKDTSLVWPQGSGVFVNNYENFIVWVNTREDQLKIVSTAQGKDLKYVLLRLHKAIFKIEEALKSSQERGFTTDCRGFSHNQLAVNGTGLEIRFSIHMPGFSQAGKAEIEKSKSDLHVAILPESRDRYEVLTKQTDEMDEFEIVTRSIDAVDKLWKRDMELQSRLGVKLSL